MPSHLLGNVRAHVTQACRLALLASLKTLPMASLDSKLSFICGVSLAVARKGSFLWPEDLCGLDHLLSSLKYKLRKLDADLACITWSHSSPNEN